ncbi:MAG: hypothetical protein ABSG87_04245 [Verrucomicrobiota bacterium]
MDASEPEKRWTEKFASHRSLRWLHSPWAGLILVAIAFVVAAFVSWHKWPDILIDFGMQLYLPWRISAGDVLYRDLHYLSGGPLSQYFNALLFKIFGVSFRTLIFANLAITAATLVLIYRRFLAAADRLTATTICLSIVLVFAFNEYTFVGNYNYIAPYSHEIFHGLVLSILAIALLSDWVSKGKIKFAFAAGFCFGLVFLTKPDIFVALAISVAVAFAIFFATRGKIEFALKSLAAFLLAVLIPLFGFFFYFLTVENWRPSLDSVAFAWWPLFHSVEKNQFYLWCLGLDTPAWHLRQMTTHFLFVALAVALYPVLFRRAKQVKWMVQLALTALLVAAAFKFNWLDAGASLPLLAMSLCLLLFMNYKKLSLERETTFPLLWSVFSLLLLAKLGLFSRVWHYGFALAMPAAVGAIYLLLWLLPRLLEKKYDVDPRPFRLAVWMALMVGFGILFHQSASWYALKKLPVGQGGDEIIAFDPRINPSGEGIKEALAWIDKNVPRKGTLAILPEGTTINYLSRRVNPTPCLDWTPTVLSVFGQTNMTATFEKNPPDYILLVERDTSEFGVGYFGHYPGYGTDLMRWIEKNYQPVQLIGNEPLQNGLFGIKILKRQE